MKLKPYEANDLKNFMLESCRFEGKRFPVIESDINYVNVTIYSNIMDSEVLQILDFLAQHYQLNQKEIIAVGVVAREKRILGYDLSQILQLKDDDRLRNWVGNLIKKEILITEGKTKGLMYMLNPKILSSMEHGLKPSLKTMEEPHLRALIIEDLKIHPKSKISEIYGRRGDLELKYLRRVVYRMREEGVLGREGENKNMVYFLPNKKENKSLLNSCK